MCYATASGQPSAAWRARGRQPSAMWRARGRRARPPRAAARALDQKGLDLLKLFGENLILIGRELIPITCGFELFFLIAIIFTIVFEKLGANF